MENKINEEEILESVSHLSAYDGINELLKLRKELDFKKPSKPNLATKHTIVDVILYSKLLLEYENNIIVYKEQLSVINKYNSEIDSIINEFLKKESNLYNLVPKQYQDKCVSLAYQRGHSEGYIGFYNNLCEIVEIFNI